MAWCCRTKLPGSRHVWHQYVIRTARRDALARLPDRRKIGSEIYYPVPLHMQEALKGLGYARRQLPRSRTRGPRSAGPAHLPELREDEQQTVVAAIAEFLS